MKAKRTGAALSLLAAGALMLSACGSDNNTGASGGGTGGSATGDIECGGKKSLKASGSSAQANAMTRFVTAYETACPGYTLNYTSSGSGAGVSEFIGAQTDFGGSDSPLNAEKGEVEKAAARCGDNPAWNLPAVFGPIAVTYNVAGVDGIVLDGPTLAKIFNGTVTTWDAPEIKALNEGAALPAEPINVLFRSDESGTTDNFQKYLEAASDGAWGRAPARRSTVASARAPRATRAHRRRSRTPPGSITYNEWSYARARACRWRRSSPRRPGPVELTTESAGNGDRQP